MTMKIIDIKSGRSIVFLGYCLFDEHDRPSILLTFYGLIMENNVDDEVLDIIKVSGPGLGLELNIKKTKIFWPLCNGMKLREGLFPVDIQRSSLGVKLTGGAISRDKNFISGLAMRRAANAVDLTSLLSQLHDSQDDFGQHMSPVEYRTIPKYRLMIPLFLVDAICPACRKACLDSFEEHVVHCKELSGFKYQHDMVRDVLFDILGQAALKAASCKVTKHEKACIENQHVFIPFAFDTFGFLAPEAVELLSRV
nr:reverse transcriptase domain-containing protein [Tanacetum cinerariifolium]